MLMGKKVIGTIAYMGGVMTVPEVFCKAWGNMIQYNNDYLCEPNESISYDSVGVSYHSYARNCLVEKMRGDWLLMLDTDISFEPDIAARLLYRLNRYNIDVLTSLYQYKAPPHSPVVYAWEEKIKSYAPIGSWDSDADIFEIGSAGAGCLLVRRKVFERIRQTKEGPFDILPPYSEDHSFFERLRKLDIKAYCCPHIEVNHLKVHPLSLEDYRRNDVDLSERKEIGGFR